MNVRINLQFLFYGNQMRALAITMLFHLNLHPMHFDSEFTLYFCSFCCLESMHIIDDTKENAVQVN